MSKINVEDNVKKCAMVSIMNVIRGKWSIPIIYALHSGTLRFKALERCLPNINTRMLVKELKNLEAQGVVERKAYATVPPTVEYSLSPKGKKLVPILENLCMWGIEFLD
ncbi:MAG: helix-turn-helix domain-containing protein [Bacteroidota bacterium]